MEHGYSCFSIYIAELYACTIYIANLHGCTIYIAVVHACTIYIVDLHACTILHCTTLRSTWLYDLRSRAED